MDVPWQDTVPGPLITRSPEGSSFAVNTSAKQPNIRDIDDDYTPKSLSLDPLIIKNIKEIY